MKFLIDSSPKKLAARKSALIGGQLLTPLTRYANAGLPFAIDNGACTGLDRTAFASLLKREYERRDQCLFVTAPDIVGSARRTLELWRHRDLFIQNTWRVALVAQDGLENLECPWDELDALFIGGCDPWKDSRAAVDLVKTAKALGKHAHVGRVNTLRRYLKFMEAGADTCDGSGVAMYDHMLTEIESGLNRADAPTLF